MVDNQALSELLNERLDLTVFLDTWEGEPAINQTLMKQVDFATPHIAGYSVEGKLRGTQMILAAACKFFKAESNWSMTDYLPVKQLLQIQQENEELIWSELFKTHYSIQTDHQELMALAQLPKPQLAIEFDLLRKNYPARYEYSRYSVKAIKDKTVASQVERLLFELNSN